MNQIPEPIRTVLETFKALAGNPELYLASVEALHEATRDLATVLSLPPPTICAHGTVLVGGYVKGERINSSGAGCPRCYDEMYDATGFSRCPHGVIGGNGCRACIETQERRG